MATAVVPKVLKNFINGEWIESTSGRAFENRNPANTDDLVGMFPASTAEDVDAAVAAAQRGARDRGAWCRRRSGRRFCIARRRRWSGAKRIWRAT